MTTVAEVRLWGTRVGAVAIETGHTHARFQYAPDFAANGIEISPLVMPLALAPYRFPELSPASFHGLPGLLADSLPDRFGNALIDAWLARQGRAPADFNAVERLSYVGQRGIGALEYHPIQGPRQVSGHKIEVDALVHLASEILTRRAAMNGSFLDDGAKEEALRDILRVGTSAGGARAKALIAWNPQTNEVRSGQVAAGKGFEYWLLKFDGVAGNKDKELEDPAGYGRIEYAYYLMAQAAGIEMMPCRIMQENGRAHFMTRRFDRTATGEKIHTQSLAALAHYDFNLAGAYSYEQAFAVIRRLGLDIDSIEEQYRRMVFNIVGRNQDDHVKNIAFLMDKSGRWKLSPAFDLTYSYNPSGEWTATHQMTANGKREGFERDDLLAVARAAGMQRTRARDIVEHTVATVRRWPEFAERAEVPGTWASRIAAHQRIDI